MKLNKMKTEKLLEILSLLGVVRSTNWGLVAKIVDAIKNGAEVLDKQWFDDFKKNHLDIYPLDLSNIRTWSTMDNCVYLRFSNDNQLVCNAKIYDYTSYGASVLRFEANIALTNDFVHNLESIILSGLDEYLEDKYQEYLEEQKLKWINNLKNRIL